MKYAATALILLGVVCAQNSEATGLVDDGKTSMSKPHSYNAFYTASDATEDALGFREDEQKAALVSAQLDRESAQMMDTASRSGTLAPLSDEDVENEYLDNYYQTYYESVAFVPVVNTVFSGDSPYAQVEFATPIMDRFGAMEVLEVSPKDVSRLESGEILFVEDLDCAPQSRPIVREILDQFSETSIGYVPPPAPFDDQHITSNERRELKAQIYHKKMHLGKGKYPKKYPYPTNPVVKKYPVYQPRYKHVKKSKLKKPKAIPYVHYSDSESCSDSYSHSSSYHGNIKYSKTALKNKALYMKNLSAQKYAALMAKKHAYKGKGMVPHPPVVHPPIEDSSEDCSYSHVYYGKNSKAAMKKKYAMMQHKMIALKNKNAPYKAKYSKKITHEL